LLLADATEIVNCVINRTMKYYNGDFGARGVAGKRKSGRDAGTAVNIIGARDERKGGDDLGSLGRAG
jgi:hypothetical protein